MARTRWSRRLLALGFAGTLLLAGCSDDGGDDASSDEGGSGTGGEQGSAPVDIGDVNDEGTVDLSADGDAPSLEMELDDNYFGPTFVQVTPGATVTLELHNEGDRRHTFTTDEVDEELDAGATAEVEVTVEDGTLEFHCEIHDDAGMRGAFFTEG